MSATSDRQAPIQHSGDRDRTASFFSSLHGRAVQRHPELFASSTPSTTGLRVEIAKGVALWFGFSGGLPRVDLYLLGTAGRSPKEVFDLLHAQKDEIERRFGGPLDWERMDGQSGSRVRVMLDGSLHDEGSWPALHDTMIDTMVRLEAALRPAIDALHL